MQTANSMKPKSVNPESYWDEIGKPILCMLLMNWGVIAFRAFLLFIWAVIHSWQASQQGV
jgi:hypothetical protein